MATQENTGTNAIWAIVVLVLVAIIVWLFLAGPLASGGNGGGATDINVDVNVPGAEAPGQ